MFVGSSRGLVEDYKHEGPPFHGDDGFGNTKFTNKPDLSKINVKEPASLALIRMVNSFPGKMLRVQIKENRIFYNLIK